MMWTDAKRRARWSGAVVVTSLILAGCGGGESDDTDAAPPVTEGGADEAEDAADAPADEDGDAEGAGSSTTVAAADSFDSVIEAARAEETLVVYSVHGPERLENLAAAFRDAYPDIEVEAIRLSDADLVATVDSEFATGGPQASLLVSTQIEWVEQVSNEGKLVPPSGPMFEAGSPYDYETYVRQGDIFEVGAAVLTFGWNTDLYPQGISDYPDLLDPALADGKLGTIDAGLSSTQVDFYLWLERNFGAEYVDELAAQAPRIYPSALPTNEALIAGEIYASPYTSPYGLAQAKAAGAPVDFAVSPTAGAWGAKHLGMLPAGAPSPNAALVFANFMLSPEGQEQSQAVTAAVLDDIPGVLLTNAGVEDLDREGQQPENVEAYLERWTGLFR